MSRKLSFPVFDVDNHMYETTDAFTKYLPKEYEGLIKYVELNGRTKIAIKNKISEYIPNPTFEADIAARSQVEQLAPRLDRVDGRLGKAKTHQPPATGGMKTTASPAASLRDQSLNSLLTATFSCSRGRVKP